MAVVKNKDVKAAAALKAMGDVPKGHARFLRVSTAEKGATAGFWRAGVKHTSTPVDHALDAFDADQMEALFAEPKLKAEFVDVKDEKADK